MAKPAQDCLCSWIEPDEHHPNCPNHPDVPRTLPSGDLPDPDCLVQNGYDWCEGYQALIDQYGKCHDDRAHLIRKVKRQRQETTAETHSVELTDEDRERLIHALAAYQYELEDNAIGDVSEKVEWTWEMRRRLSSAW